MTEDAVLGVKPAAEEDRWAGGVGRVDGSAAAEADWAEDDEWDEDVAAGDGSAGRDGIADHAGSGDATRAVAGDGSAGRDGIADHAGSGDTTPAVAEDQPVVQGTGHPAVDAAVRAVANAATLPVAEQLAAYEGAHETLREVLASIED